VDVLDVFHQDAASVFILSVLPKEGKFPYGTIEFPLIIQNFNYFTSNKDQLCGNEAMYLLASVAPESIWQPEPNGGADSAPNPPSWYLDLGAPMKRQGPQNGRAPVEGKGLPGYSWLVLGTVTCFNTRYPGTRQIPGYPGITQYPCYFSQS